ncbi:hypothetical protein [Agrobacterium tumefaciens]|uniref:Uncharacterized protein n=1 Tax=Agrobacterium tumefaciens TaxID=358 RepID=A0A4D7YNJ7_AGRTU|nr:hypothetical protein [Agrobacterium tumefaciens]QCL92892.1 hypothetical protein CFBP7129_00790 [Agrobacterium tumefaciens]
MQTVSGPENWVSWLSVAANIATLLALTYAGYQTKVARFAASASASSLIFSNLRNDIDRIAAQPDDTAHYWATCDFLNNLEFACAMYFDGQLSGKTGSLTMSLIKSMMGIVERNPKLQNAVARAVHDPTTFEFIRKFAGKHKKDWKPLNH